MAAAPADFRPASYSATKIKKAGPDPRLTVELVPTPDIAAELGARKAPGQVLVAFAAETHDGPANALEKLARKRADLVVLNEVGPDKAFGTELNSVTVFGPDGSVQLELADAPKQVLADMVLNLVNKGLR
jgi:phosphopantothenoylcysteine decarboxylase/phosphopantothenate--cysteine ligase